MDLLQKLAEWLFPPKQAVTGYQPDKPINISNPPKESGSALVKEKIVETYICEHFQIEELVPPEVVAELGQEAWKKMTYEIKRTLDLIRDHFKVSITVNNATQHYRGLRTPKCAEYSPGSQHSIGNAADFHVGGMDSAAVRKHILANQDMPEFALIGGLEDFEGMSWVHVDCRPRVNGKIVVFSKK